MCVYEQACLCCEAAANQCFAIMLQYLQNREGEVRMSIITDAGEDFPEGAWL